MAKMKPRTLSGFMELLPAPQAQMERIMEVLRETYSLYGFTALDTPAIEDAQVLLAKGGGETEKQIYRFQKGDSDLALRFDLTVPLAKYVALYYGELSFPFRRYQIGKVYRGERAQKGRFREFYQADIDIIGDGSLSMLNEAEIPAIIYRAFHTLGLERFQIRVNNRKILSGFYEMLNLSDQATEIMRTVDKLDKIGADMVRDILVDDLCILPEKAEKILRFIAVRGSNQEVLNALEEFRGENQKFDQGLDEPEVGSICSGGRYDNLAEYYTDKSLPGVGISIGLTRLFYVLNECHMLSDQAITAPADVLVIPMTEDLTPAIALATQLRDQGIRTQIYAEQKKTKAKQQKHVTDIFQL